MSEVNTELVEVGDNLFYSELVTIAEVDNYTITEIGLNRIGENLIVLNHHDKDLTYSFLLTGATSSRFIYTCVYTDN